MLATACPSAERLRQYLLGQVADPEAGELDEHLTHCPNCFLLADAQCEEDNFVRAVREGGAGSRPRNLVIEQLCSRLRFLPLPTAVLAAGENTAPTSLEQTTGGGGETMPLLGPPQGPDELGRLRGYRVLRVLGAGGMGVVYEAEHITLGRRVALKAMRPVLTGDPHARERFLREARAMAAFTHDNIATIFEVDEDAGVSFLAMPLLQGETLEDRLAREGRLPVGEVMRIGRETALGLAAAHERGVIHRDVKPGNLWLESPTGRVKILDFGLARPVEQEIELTRPRTILGTPSYMAPEQMNGQPGPQSDLFSLGCVLYRAATGQPAFPGAGLAEVCCAVMVHEPAPPRDLNPELSLALSDLIMRLLAKDAANRPASATAVVKALEEMGRSPVEPTAVVAEAGPKRPISARRWMLAAAVLLVLGPLGFLFAPTLLRVVTNKGELVVEVDDPNVEVVVKQNGVIVEDRTTRRTFVLTAVDGEIEVLEKDGVSLNTKRFSLRRGGKTVIAVTRQELVRREPLPHGNGEKPAAAPRTPFDRLKASSIPDVEKIGGQPAGLVAVWGSHAFRQPGPVSYVAFTAGGKRVVSAGMEWGGYRHVLNVWDRVTGRVETTVEEVYLDGFTNSYAATPDGKTAVLSRSYNVTLRDLPTGKVRKTVEGGHFGEVFLSADAKLLWVGAYADRVDRNHRIVDVATGVEIARFEAADWIKSLNLTRAEWLSSIPAADCRTVALRVPYTGEDKKSRVAVAFLDVTTKKLRRLDHQDKLSPEARLQFMPDGKSLASWDRSELLFWDVVDGKLLRRTTFPRALHHTSWPFSPDGKTIATALKGADIQLLDVDSGNVLRTLVGHEERVFSIAFSPDGKEIVSGGECGTVRLWDVKTGKQLNPLTGHQGPTQSVIVSPNSDSVASCADKTIVLRDAASGKQRGRFIALTRFTCLAYTGKGKKLVAGCDDGSYVSWDAASGKEFESILSNKGPVTALAGSPDGQWLAAAHGPAVLLLDAETCKGQLVCRWDSDQVSSISFSPDGARLALGGRQGAIKIVDTATGKDLANLKQQKAPIRSVAFSPDGKRLAASDGTLRPVFGGDSVKGEVRVWDIATGKPTATFTERSGWGWGSEITTVAFAADGQSIYSSVAKVDRRVIQWLSPTKTREWSFPFPINSMTLAPDGRHLLTANGDGTVYVLRLPGER